MSNFGNDNFGDDPGSGYQPVGLNVSPLCGSGGSPGWFQPLPMPGQQPLFPGLRVDSIILQPRCGTGGDSFIEVRPGQTGNNGGFNF